MPEGMKMIEDIILSNDIRGISALRSFLPANSCEQAGKLIMKHPGTVLIVTGFFVPSEHAPETDGPAGAMAIARSMTKLGRVAHFVTDDFSAPLMKSVCKGEYNTIVFPMADQATSNNYAIRLLNQFKPSIIISIERCGMSDNGKYLNMAGADISRYNAKIDFLFHHHKCTIGIGDGGNEIGMGNIADVIPSVASLPKKPSITRVTNLIIASVSNWGAYGLVAAMSMQSKHNLLPLPDEEDDLIRQIVALGAVDGITKQRVSSVDSFPLKVNNRVLQRLHRFLETQM